MLFSFGAYGFTPTVPQTGTRISPISGIFWIPPILGPRSLGGPESIEFMYFRMVSSRNIQNYHNWYMESMYAPGPLRDSHVSHMVPGWPIMARRAQKGV